MEHNQIPRCCSAVLIFVALSAATMRLDAACEIQVSTGATEIADGSGNFTFGSTVIGRPTRQSFTVRNAGPDPLTLTPPINVPMGFSVRSGFGSNTLSADERTTFTLELNAITSGTFAGTVSFANNDSDENPFDFTVSGSVGATTSSMDITQTLSDQAQRTTLAFDALAIMTGNLEAQSFFPPGKVADYTGFQYLRDNDPDSMGHNTSFLTRVANNVIYILSDAQLEQLKTLAVAQIAQINQYGYQRFPLMKAFRRLIDGAIPAGSPGLNLAAVRQASQSLYALDGQISFDRALLYATILNSFSTTQTAYLETMKGHGWGSWPDIPDDLIRSRMSKLPQGTSVAVMTYAGDLFSWYAGSVDADFYFCPERHGTYFGSFYMKDAPAVGHEGYSIDEALTGEAGSALCDSSRGYVTTEQATAISSLIDVQRNNLFAGPTNIVQLRTTIATLLRSLLVAGKDSNTVRDQVLALSKTYGELDGENNYQYATTFAQVYRTLTPEQKSALQALRHSILSGTYADGASFDFTVCATPYLYSAVITDLSTLTPYIGNTDYLFLIGNSAAADWQFYE